MDEEGIRCANVTQDAYTCCGKYHGYLYKNWMYAMLDLPLDWNINGTDVKNIPVGVLQYYYEISTSNV